jgi:copper(I)-binding protein
MRDFDMLRFSLAAAAVLLCTTSFAHDHPAGAAQDDMPEMEMNDPAAAGGPAVTAGDLELSGAFTRATLPNAPVGGGYLTITNKGTSDDRLVSVSTPVAGTSQIHQMKMDGDVMKMNALPDGLVIPAGGTVRLEPGGYHLMFMDLQEPLVEGQSLSVTLTFEKAGTVELQLPIGSPAAKGPATDHSKHSELVTLRLGDFA